MLDRPIVGCEDIVDGLWELERVADAVVHGHDGRVGAVEQCLYDFVVRESIAQYRPAGEVQEDGRGDWCCGG